MKIGVVTMFKHTPNYGGALQAYALPTFLCKMGHEAEQIFFDDSNVCEREKLSCLKSIEIEAKVFLWNMIQRLKHPLHTFKYQCRFREMVRFGMDVTPHSNKFYHYNDIQLYPLTFSVDYSDFAMFQFTNCGMFRAKKSPVRCCTGCRRGYEG